MELFTPEGIECIVSAVDKPLYLDKSTAERHRVSFARVCVEVNDEIAPMKSIEVEIEDMGHISVCVEYPW